MKKADRGALMADGHLGYIMPIGGVAAYDNRVSPCGVGFDIGCGNMAVKTDWKYTDEYLTDIDLGLLLDDIQKEISFGIGRKNKYRVDHPLFELPHWTAYDEPHRSELYKLAREQLGTVGSGNHYVDIFKDEDGFIWIGVHFGSRGLGHKTCTGFLNLAVNGRWDERAPEQEVLLDISEDLGSRYMMAMNLAGEYAKAGREWVVGEVVRLLGASITDVVHNHHNFAWTEEHGGKYYIVIRKGATPAFPGQRGFVGGSMGDDAVIIEGVDSELSKQALYSTVHGAGRVMGRREAAGRKKWKRNKVTGERELIIKSEGKITRDMMITWLEQKGVQLRGGGTDESPHVYRRLPEVLKQQGDTIRILHTLTPLGVVMAGDGEFDPYKD